MPANEVVALPGTGASVDGVEAVVVITALCFGTPNRKKNPTVPTIEMSRNATTIQRSTFVPLVSVDSSLMSGRQPGRFNLYSRALAIMQVLAGASIPVAIYFPDSPPR